MDNRNGRIHFINEATKFRGMEHEFYEDNCYSCRFYKVFGRRCLLDPRYEKWTKYGSRNEKGASIKNADKVTKLSCRPFLYSRDGKPRLRERNEPEEQEDRHKHRESSKLSDKHKNSTDIKYKYFSGSGKKLQDMIEENFKWISPRAMKLEFNQWNLRNGFYKIFFKSLFTVWKVRIFINQL